MKLGSDTSLSKAFSWAKTEGITRRRAGYVIENSFKNAGNIQIFLSKI